VQVIQAYRANPQWPIVDVVMGGEIMKTVWKRAAEPEFAYGRVFDARLAATLRHHGVTRFASRNERDFLGFGFDRVWDPIDG
jgi:predicted nucleic acid-binding protein